MTPSSDRDTILHLSDIHATRGELLYGRVDGLARLAQVGEYVVAAGLTPEAVVVSGDLIQRGHAAVYPDLAGALDRLADVVGAPVLTVLGNHDEPVAASVLPGHRAGHHRVVHVGRLRFVLLDTHAGVLDAGQLTWLQGALRLPYGRGTVVVMHHAPVASPLPALARTGLREPGSLAVLLAGTDVRLILAGHYHHPMSASFAGVPVSVGPSLAYQQVMNAGPAQVSGHDQAMFSIVHLSDDSVSCAPVSISTPAPLFTQPVHRSAPVPTS